MTFALILAGLIAVLLTGLPVFAGLLLFSVALSYGVEGHLGGIGDLVFGSLDTYLLVAIPLFSLMAHFMIRGKVVDDLFGAAHVLLRHLPGGLGVATVVACTVFAAISGSSVATALTVGAAAIPLMIRYGYSPRFAYGVVAAGGTLGILIPPSGPMVLFGVVSDTSIGALFIAGIVPGLMLALMFAAYSMTAARFGARRIATEPRASAAEVVAALRRSFWALTLPAFVLGGMYFGVFTATEAAAAGALGALLIATLVYRNFGVRDIWASAVDAARNSAMLFLILAAAAVLGNVLTKLRIPQQIVELVTQLGVSQIDVPARRHGADLRARHVPRDDLDHPDHDAGRAAGARRAEDPPRVVRHPAHDQPRARADHAAGRHEPVRVEGDHAGRRSPISSPA